MTWSSEEIFWVENLWQRAANEPCKSPFDDFILDILGVMLAKVKSEPSLDTNPASPITDGRKEQHD